MARIKAFRSTNGNGYSFTCPGCGDKHAIRIEGPPPAWGWNSSLDKPTFTPSVLFRSGHYLPEHKAGSSCWCTYNSEHPDKPAPFKCEVCHSLVTDGRIQFLGDCTHALAGQTVDLPEIKSEVV